MGHRIYVDDQLTPFNFEEADDYNLLDCLEKQGVQMNYHCRAGFCGACRSNLTKGEVDYPGGTPLVYLREGEILPCSCVPTSDIEIQTNH